MVEQQSLFVTAQLPSAKRFLEGTSERGLRPGDASRSANGCFNHCLFFEPQGVVLRFPRSPEERAAHTQSIRQELASIGPGIGFELRPPARQVALIDQAKRRGLMAPDIVDTVGNAVLMKAVDGVTLDKYVQQDPVHIDTKIIERVITHTTESHTKEIVIGDRWNANTMVTNDRRQIVELDHDIELIGPPQKKKAFELAQNLYHLIHFSDGHRDFMSDTILDIYKRNSQMLSTYDLSYVRLFLHKHTQYHYDNFKTKGDLYEGFVPPKDEIYELIDRMEEIKNSRSKLIVQGVTLFVAA